MKIKNTKTYYFQVPLETEFKALTDKQKSGEGTKVKGYASTVDVDRYKDIVLPEAFEKSILDTYSKNPIILFQHKHDRPIGTATFAGIDLKGLLVEALIQDDEVEPKIQNGTLRAFSIGFIVKAIKLLDADKNEVTPDSDGWFDYGKVAYKQITELDLLEISVVSVPANATSLFDLQKSIKSFFCDMESGECKLFNQVTTKKMKVKNLLNVKSDEENTEVIEDENTETETEEGTEEETPTKPVDQVDESSDDETSVEDKGDETNTEVDEEETDETDGENTDGAEEAKSIKAEKDLMLKAIGQVQTENKSLKKQVESLTKQLNVIPKTQVQTVTNGIQAESKGKDIKKALFN